ncbi:hypothetical protein [Runella aurantiaca]|uniref:Uncharacterized protein n=1 Tax=Runella aurantiaca TaxID=2282308 RepID=A0A369IKD8_9BACT|nr:hypothetical protein [Runella aurantiaca]RDB07096.1 hypothetical protein DVG78_03470 [Runella aurantiaca]
MQNKPVKSALEELKLTEEASTASENAQLIPLEQSEEEPKNDAKSKKATIAATAAGLVGGIAGTALGAQNADFIGGIFDRDNDEPVAVEPDPEPHAGPADEPTPQNSVPQDEPVEVVPEAIPVAEDTPVPADTSEPIPVDLNNDGTVDVVAIDSNHDGTAEGMATDEDHDGKVDTYYIDTDQDGDMDTILIDTNQDGTPDSENTLAADQEITLQLEDQPDVPQEEVHQDTTVVDTPEAVDNTITDNDIPQDEFDPNADMSEWA